MTVTSQLMTPAPSLLKILLPVTCNGTDRAKTIMLLFFRQDKCFATMVRYSLISSFCEYEYTTYRGGKNKEMTPACISHYQTRVTK